MAAFVIEGRTVEVFPGAVPGSPVVYLNTCEQEGEAVCRQLRAGGCPDLSLVAVGGLDWSRDMAPWDCPPISAKAAPCTGGADEYLAVLLHRIMPAAEQLVPGSPAWRGIAGYSLGGLFAVYALCRTDVFARAASVSGSLWFPGIGGYLLAHPPLRRPDCIYFSLGDREDRTRNPFLRAVRQNTEQIAAFYAGQGVDTVFQLNPGSHFRDVPQRTAAGLRWMAGR